MELRNSHTFVVFAPLSVWVRPLYSLIKPHIPPRRVPTPNIDDDTISDDD